MCQELYNKLNVSFSVQELLTVERCLQAISLRGLIRVWCSVQLPNILHFFTRRGYVNCGLLIAPSPSHFPFNTPDTKVLRIYSFHVLLYISLFLTHSPTHPLTHPHAHPPTHPPTHPLTHSELYSSNRCGCSWFSCCSPSQQLWLPCECPVLDFLCLESPSVVGYAKSFHCR